MLLWNLKFADDIDLLAGTNIELQELTHFLATILDSLVVPLDKILRLVQKK